MYKNKILRSITSTKVDINISSWFFLIILLFILTNCNRQDSISELGGRFITHLKGKTTVSFNDVLVFTPSDCESCILKDIELLDILQSNPINKNVIVVSTATMIKHFNPRYNNINFLEVSNIDLQRFGHIGNLGTLYDLSAQTEFILSLDAQPSNIVILKTLR